MALRREPSWEGSVQSQAGVRVGGEWWLLEQPAAGRRGAFGYLEEEGSPLLAVSLCSGVGVHRSRACRSPFLAVLMKLSPSF